MKESYSDRIERARGLIANAEYVLIALGRVFPLLVDSNILWKNLKKILRISQINMASMICIRVDSIPIVQRKRGWLIGLDMFTSIDIWKKLPTRPMPSSMN